MALALCLMWQHALGEPLRVATWGADLSREGPGLLLQGILRDDDPALDAVVQGLALMRPDVVLLTDIDFDAGLAALSALGDHLARHGIVYPHMFALRPNSGIGSGLDMDGDGRLGEPEDALGWGRFAGQGGMAILSRYPVAAGDVADLSGLIWQALPFADPPRDFPTPAAAALRPLSSTGHWIVPIVVSDRVLSLLVFAATPPAYEGAERLNTRRNRDEIRLWDWAMRTGRAPDAGFVLMGNANLDPDDGGGDRAAMRALLADPRLQDPRPRSAGAAASAESGQRGDPALHTAQWPDGAPGDLRVSYVLPAADLVVTGAGVWWPAPDDPMAAVAAAAGAHRMVWVDLDLK